jgi:peptidoglycan/xylan/chitin deacetylase (PgdA/CDA1 family)
MLWNMLSHLKCPQQRLEREFRTILTHDVDEPFSYALKSPITALKQLGNDLLKSKKPVMAFDNAYKWLQIRRGVIELDPYNTFDYIMDTSEKLNLKSQFHFIAERCTAFDGNYNLHHRLLRKLMRKISTRGHEIGLHSSYGSADNPFQTRKEIDALKTLCSEEGISQSVWCSRQHYLRWETPTTSDNLEFAGLDYDTTLSYADAAGFRCGVCYEFPLFNILARQCLKLRERPLVVMECSVIDERYMNLGTDDEAFAVIKSVKDTCRRFNGDFTILWHNTRFIDPKERELYNQVLLT